MTLFYFQCFLHSENISYYLYRIFKTIRYYVKKTTLVLCQGDKTVVAIEHDDTHSRNPFLDQLEIFAETIDHMVRQHEHLSKSEKLALGHIRHMTRQRKGSKK